MSESEFDRLLEAVRTAIAPAPEEPSMTYYISVGELTRNAIVMGYGRRQKAANDNHLAWPFIPFPEGWCASC